MRHTSIKYLLHFASLIFSAPVANDNNQLIIIIILTATVTALIHFILCAVHICCHGNRELRRQVRDKERVNGEKGMASSNFTKQ